MIYKLLDPRSAKSHAHDGTLDFKHLSYHVVPRNDANRIYRKALREQAEKPKRDGERRKLGNVAVHVSVSEMNEYQDAWHLLGDACVVATHNAE